MVLKRESEGTEKKGKRLFILGIISKGVGQA
jgi:hypothetical protein